MEDQLKRAGEYGRMSSRFPVTAVDGEGWLGTRRKTLGARDEESEQRGFDGEQLSDCDRGTSEEEKKDLDGDGDSLKMLDPLPLSWQVFSLARGSQNNARCYPLPGCC